MDTIKESKWVLLKMPSGLSRLMTFSSKTTVKLGKFGEFKSSELIGKPYNVTYEIYDRNRLRLAQSESLLDKIEFEQNEDANNQFINNKSDQKLSSEEIVQLRTNAVTGEAAATEVVETLIKNNESFDKKTDFSKAKYIKKKDKKYLRILTPIQPTARTLCEHFFEETPQKILNLRVDSLSQILTHANVHVGCRTLVVDETEGIVVSALMERMGLEGELLMIHNNDIQKMKIPAYMNFSVELWERTQKLPWTKIQDDGKEDLDVDGMVLQPGQTEEDLEKFKRQISNKIKGVKLGREALNKGSFDALIIATDNDPTAIIEKLLPYVAPSRPVVVYNPHKEYLVKPYLAMRGVKTMINVRLTDSWMREYQVPVHASGTHPIMTMSGHGGFILTGLKVLDNEVVHAYTKRDKAQKTGTKKKMKLDEEDQAE